MDRDHVVLHPGPRAGVGGGEGWMRPMLARVVPHAFADLPRPPPFIRGEGAEEGRRKGGRGGAGGGAEGCEGRGEGLARGDGPSRGEVEDRRRELPPQKPLEEARGRLGGGGPVPRGATEERCPGPPFPCFDLGVGRTGRVGIGPDHYPGRGGCGGHLCVRGGGCWTRRVLCLRETGVQLYRAKHPPGVLGEKRPGARADNFEAGRDSACPVYRSPCCQESRARPP